MNTRFSLLSVLSISVSITISICIINPILTLADITPVAAAGTMEEALKKSAPEQYCQLQTLKNLGWTVESTAGDKNNLSLEEGDVCNSDNLQEAKRNGYLKLKFSQISAFDEENFQKTSMNEVKDQIGAALKGSASVCAYKFLVGKAISKATGKLIKNTEAGKYTFGIPDGKFCEASGGEWVAGSYPYPMCIYPKTSPKAAMDCFYNNDCQSECAVGLQVGLLTTQRELFGEEFDEAFQKEQVILGPWTSVQLSDNPFWTYKGKEDVYLDSKKLADMGRQAFVGVAGVIWNKLGEEYLDSPNDRGENYVIVSITKAAALKLKDENGIDEVNKLNHELWTLNTKAINPATPAQEAAELKEKMNQILKHPIYSGVRTFVHPLGIKTYGEHVTRLLELNPRTPYDIKFYNTGSNEGIYDIFVNHQVKSCLKKLNPN